MKTVTGIFNTRTQAREAIEQLGAAGFDAGQVNLIAGADKAKAAAEEVNMETSEEDAHIIGSTATYAGISNWLMAPGVAGLPTEDRIDVFGPITEAIRKAGMPVGVEGGPLPKGLHQALVGWGLSDAQIGRVEQRLRQGAVLVAVDVIEPEMVKRAQQILYKDGADNVTAAQVRS